MPQLTIEGHGTHDVEKGKRLVNAIAEAGVEIGHRCGGYAKCTTCRVEVLDGEPQPITEAEKEKLADAGLEGEVRLACQILVNHDMKVKPLMTVGDQPWDDPGPEPEEKITPDPVWIEQ